ncbi:MAG: MBOAT family protein [Oscillospiraceae bacterium]|nr:MBOAT family protein [Oscillospiraceae bacterium]
MVFSDLFFMYAFLPVCLLLYYVCSHRGYRNVVLAAFSLFFYAWGEPVWVLLLIFSALVDYCNGLFIGWCRKDSKHEKLAVWGVVSSLVINLGLLGVFKYSGFIVENINTFAGTSFKVPEFALPIGISFYTFQTITYSVDVYRKKVSVQKSFLNFLLYVSMFFQLVAGPIVRYEHVENEINSRRTDIKEINSGFIRFVYGLAKKVLIANCTGELAVSALSFESAPSSVFAAWFGVIMFSLQIYYDFSGYSDMAIGLGMMFGFHFPENFNYPYVSRSATEFWRRWHISLGSFFRDYVYIPLGGNRKRVYFNLAVTWFLTGLWHGASWNFVLWGCYFGLLIMIEKLFLLKVFDKIPKLFSHLYALFIVIIGWAMFYFTDMTQLTACLKAMFGMSDIPLMDEITKSGLLNNVYLIAAAVIFSVPIYKLITEKTERLGRRSQGAFVMFKTAQTAVTLVLLAVSSVMLVGQTYNPFLYFRF